MDAPAKTSIEDFTVAADVIEGIEQAIAKQDAGGALRFLETFVKGFMDAAGEAYVKEVVPRIQALDESATKQFVGLHALQIG